MTTASTSVRANVMQLATGDVSYTEGGSGPDLLLLHHDIGSTGWGDFHEELARHFRVMAVDLPGYGASARLEWARHPRDVAAVVLAFARRLGLRETTLAGLGFGGWVACEMAAFAANDFRRLALVAPAGLKPERTYILDQVMMSYPDYVAAGFSDAATAERFFPAERRSDFRDRFDQNREVIARIAWKPYMYSYELEETLREMHVPTLVAWGTADRVIPIECADRFAAILPDCTLRFIEGGGHFLDLEQPAAVAALIVDHASLTAKE